jgi:protein-S-isoprenylcysteine O-methyltransferase Ste14
MSNLSLSHLALGALLPGVVYALVLLLNVVVPGRWVNGYVVDGQGRPLRYHLNGLPVLVLVVGGFALVAWQGLVAWDVFYTYRWGAAAGACVIGLVFTLAIVLTAPPTPGASLGADLYLGRRENPRWGGGRVDAKMFLYLVGAVMLELNVVSFAAHHVLLYPDAPSSGVLLYAGLFTFFLIDYLTFERVHLYTYDLFAERVGFKLGWGCLVFYPYFYCIGLWALADRPDPHTPTALLVAFAAIFFAGWSLSRGANLQKFLFKIRPDARLFGLIAPRTVESGDRRLLCSGFWRLSRHINYLGEILMATGLALALGYPLSLAPWLYPIYYLLLLLPRERADDRRCAAKYGALWDEYCRKVPYRVVPGVY